MVPSCQNVLYCSRHCQDLHWAVHREQCSRFSCQTMKGTLKGGLGEKVSWCMVDCFIGGQRCQALWDTGSQVTLIDKQWKDSNLPHSPLRDVSEVLDMPEPLELVAAN